MIHVWSYRQTPLYQGTEPEKRFKIGCKATLTFLQHPTQQFSLLREPSLLGSSSPCAACVPHPLPCPFQTARDNRGRRFHNGKIWAQLNKATVFRCWHAQYTLVSQEIHRPSTNRRISHRARQQGNCLLVSVHTVPPRHLKTSIGQAQTDGYLTGNSCEKE